MVRRILGSMEGQIDCCLYDDSYWSLGVLRFHPVDVDIAGTSTAENNG